MSNYSEAEKNKYWLLAPQDNPIRGYEKFISYLAVDTELLDYEAHPKNLNWLPFAIHARNLQNTPNPVNPLDDEKLLPFKKLIQEYSPHYANMKTTGERHSLVYFNTDSQSVEATKPALGSYLSVKPDIIEVFENGFYPLVDMHTHPTDSLPSPVDYRIMLCNFLGDRKTRMVKSILVLTPNEQILALATAQTPMYELNEVDRAEQDTHSIIYEDEKLKELSNLNKELLYSQLQKVQKDYEKTFEIFMKAKKMPIPILNSLEKVLLNYMEVRAAIDRKRFKSKNKELTRSIFDRENTLINNAQIAYARNNWIKLYQSSDFINFHEFSA